MASFQVSTSPLLKQYATEIGEGDLTVTSKLGNSTVSRVRFKKLQYPHGAVDQEIFLRGLVGTANPTAHVILADWFDQCIKDQARAVEQLLAPSIRD